MVIKMVSPEDFGRYSVATNFINLIVIPLSGFLTAGLRRYTAYYISRNEYSFLSGIIKICIVYAFSLSIILTLPFLFFSKFISQIFLNSLEYSKFLFFYSFSIPFIIFSNYLSSFLTGLEKFKEISISNNISPNISRILFLFIWWLFLPFKEVGITLSLVFKSIVSFFQLSFYSLKKLKEFLKFEKKYEFKEWFRYSFPTFLRYVFSYIADNIGVVILGSSKNSLEAGIYRGANFLSNMLWSINLSFSSVLNPRLVHLIAQNKITESKKLMYKFMFLNILVNFIFLLMFIIFGKQLLYLLGKEYINGYNVLIILSLCSLIEAMSGVFQVYIDAKGRSDLNLISYIIYNISTIYFIALFTNLYSKEGTALGYLFGIVVLSIMRFIFYFKISK